MILDDDKSNAAGMAKGALDNFDTRHTKTDASLNKTSPTSERASAQINQQNVDVVTQSMSVESTLHFLPKPSSGDNGWTKENMAKLEKELSLALEEEQVASLEGTPTSPSPPSIKAPQNESQSRERTETVVGRPEELPGSSQHDIAQGLEWEQEETEVLIKGIMQQQDELGHLAIDDQQDLVKVIIADHFKDKEATKALPAAKTKAL